MSVPNPEAIPSDLTARDLAEAQLRNPDLTPAEHRVAWMVLRDIAQNVVTDSGSDE